MSFSLSTLTRICVLLVVWGAVQSFNHQGAKSSWKRHHGLSVNRDWSNVEIRRKEIRGVISTSSVKGRMDTQLKMTLAGTGFAALSGVIKGGLFAGGLHAIAGPDHLAALLPKCCGQRWYNSVKIGALWGIGHGISCTFLGMAAYFLKNRLSSSMGLSTIIHGASHLMEAAVGISLMIIGLMGVKEAREWEADLEQNTMSLGSAATPVGVQSKSNRGIVFNGLLHGFSWDGAPSLAPALAVASWRGNISFLLAYAIGTIVAMAATTTIIGEGTVRAGNALQRPDIPQKLSFVSSFIAVAVGAVWVRLAFIK